MKEAWQTSETFLSLMR